MSVSVSVLRIRTDIRLRTDIRYLYLSRGMWCVCVECGMWTDVSRVKRCAVSLSCGRMARVVRCHVTRRHSNGGHAVVGLPISSTQHASTLASPV